MLCNGTVGSNDGVQRVIEVDVLLGALMGLVVFVGSDADVHKV